MRPFLIRGACGLKGEIKLPGDKSIAHRAAIISSLAPGKTVISNFPANQDCLSTLKVLRKLGVKIIRNSTGTITVFGKGLYGLAGPKSPVFIGESGTTCRLVLGVLAAQNFNTKLIAAKSLSGRPMLRVNMPLRLMGAKITARTNPLTSKKEEYLPIVICGGSLKAITYKMPLPSAQVKSAILLAGLYACGRTTVIEKISTRDHTERMLKAFKADIKVKKDNIVIKGGGALISPGRIYIPGDISSASFFITAAAILPNSRVLIRNVGLNPSRTGIINVLKRMGADIRLSARRSPITGKEPMGDVIVKSSSLRGTVVKRQEIPSLIDELPVLMVAACLAKGKTVFEGAAELRVKETDRIRSMQENLTSMGAHIKVERTAGCENIVIEGAKKLKGAKVRSFSDHRTAMSMVIAGLTASGITSVDNLDCINKSFPDFLSLLKPLLH
jgi:3-phosphoshikimate 1-carboxyvinyltransferase